MAVGGVETVTRNLNALKTKIRVAAGRAVVNAMEKAVTTMKERTPVDTGALRGSGHVDGPHVDGGTVGARAVFGGPAAKYAVVVHENLRAHHPVGQAKYVESVLVEQKDALLRDAASQVVLG